MDDNRESMPPELAALMEQLERAQDPLERQQAWDALVAYQRRTGLRAQPRDSDPAQP